MTAASPPQRQPVGSLAGQRTGRLVDAVVFDFGNVLLYWDPRRAFAGRYTPSEVDRFFADVDFPAFNLRQDAGRPWSEARQEIADHHPEHLPAFDCYTRHFADTLTGPVPGMADLVRDLARVKVATFGLTNWSAETVGHAPRVCEAIALLDSYVVSGREGVAKPDERIFHITRKRFGLNPQRTMFVDDAPANVAAAAALGWHTHLFRDAQRLREALIRAGALACPAGSPPP